MTFASPQPSPDIKKSPTMFETTAIERPRFSQVISPDIKKSPTTFETTAIERPRFSQNNDMTEDSKPCHRCAVNPDDQIRRREWIMRDENMFKRARHLTHEQWQDQIGWIKHSLNVEDIFYERDQADQALVDRYRKACSLINRKVSTCALIQDRIHTHRSEFGTIPPIKVAGFEREERHTAIAPEEYVISGIYHIEMDATALADLNQAWNFYAVILVDTMHRYERRGQVDVFDIHLLHCLVEFLHEFERNLVECDIEYILNQRPFIPLHHSMTCCEKLNTQFGLFHDKVFNTLRRALHDLSYVGMRRSDMIYHYPTGLVYSIRPDTHEVELRSKVEKNEMEAFLCQREFLEKPFHKRLGAWKLLGLPSIRCKITKDLRPHIYVYGPNNANNDIQRNLMERREPH